MDTQCSPPHRRILQMDGYALRALERGSLVKVQNREDSSGKFLVREDNMKIICTDAGLWSLEVHY